MFPSDDEAMANRFTIIANHFGKPGAGSREQNFRPEDCGVCHASLIARKGHGFWEGGKGKSFLNSPFARFSFGTKPKWLPSPNGVSDLPGFLSPPTPRPFIT